MSFLNDIELEEQLSFEWDHETSIVDDKDDYATREDAEEFEEVPLESLLNAENDMIYDELEDDFLDIIEVYDESGELIATYDSAEYAKLKAQGQN